MKISISTTQQSSPDIAVPSYKMFAKSCRNAADMAFKTIDTFLEEAGEQHENKAAVPKPVCVRRVRLICTDPEATDTSSDEENEFAAQRIIVRKRLFSKRVVTEVTLPPRTCYVDATPSESNNFEVNRTPRSTPSACINRHRRIGKRKFRNVEEYEELHVFGKKNGSAGGCKGYMAAEQLSSERCAAEHKDQMRIKMGMYDSVGAADMVHYSAARHIQDCQTDANLRNTVQARKAEVKMCDLSCSNGCVIFEEYTGSVTDEAESSLCSSFADNVSGDNDTWSRNDTVDTDNSKMLSLYLDLDSMECMMNPDTEEKPQSWFQAGSPSSVLEHVMLDDSASAAKGCMDSVCSEYGVEMLSAVVASVAAQRSILVPGPDASGTSNQGANICIEPPMDALFLDDLTGFGHDIADILSLQSTCKAGDVLVHSQGACSYNGFLEDGDLAAMNFELDSEALAWIGIPAV